MRLFPLRLAVMGMLLVCLPLFGEQVSYSVGILSLQSGTEALESFVQEVGTGYANLFTIAPTSYSEYLLAKQERSSEMMKNETISLSYAKHSPLELEKASKAELPALVEPPYPLGVTYRTFPFEEKRATMLGTFEASRPWFCSKEGLDALLLIQTTELASVKRIRLFWYDAPSSSTRLIFDQVVVKQDLREKKEDIALALLQRTAGSDASMLVFDQLGPAVRIEANNEDLILSGSHTLVKPGELVLTLSSVGYASRTVSLTVHPGTITHIPGSLKPLDLGSIELVSPFGASNWYVQGSFLGNASSITLGQYSLPMLVVAQKDGFASKTIQLQSPTDSLLVELKPEWMSSVELLEEKQRGFYKSLRNTMLVFGLYVACSTLSETFEVANPLWQPLLVATSGFALVSSLQTIMNLASYASLAGSSVR